MKLIAAALVLGFVLWLNSTGQARPPVPAPVFKAVRAYWPTRAQRIQAFDVAYCESRFYPYARNGQYLGLFQFGSWARDRFGWGWDVYSQARAAHAYYRQSGWAGWECQPA